MSAVTKFFFTPVLSRRSAWDVINWWESRRAVYNVTVGAAGVVSLGVASLFSILPPRLGRFDIPWELVLLYGILANVCYTLGPLADLAIRRRWGDRYDAVGPAMLRYGFAFSVGLTLLPIPLAAIGWLARLLGFAG